MSKLYIAEDGTIHSKSSRPQHMSTTSADGMRSFWFWLINISMALLVAVSLYHLMSNQFYPQTAEQDGLQKLISVVRSLLVWASSVSCVIWYGRASARYHGYHLGTYFLAFLVAIVATVVSGCILHFIGYILIAIVIVLILGALLGF